MFTYLPRDTCNIHVYSELGKCTFQKFLLKGGSCL
ncbi:hypothetical protein VP277E431_P0260 [Vibrio phage 277E43-1]|nr:hypothetical protein VP277E431_P0260 [Vibrio phage 277E43-1]